MNLDQNATGVYTYCNVPIGVGQGLFSAINYEGWLDSVQEYADETYGEALGCNNYWFRGEYNNGTAILYMPFLGNYSIYFVDGTVAFENDYSPPKLIDSDIFMNLGQVYISNKTDTTMDFWISHDELNYWASFSDNIFLIMILVMPILFFIALTLLGVPKEMTGMVVIAWEVIWLLIQAL